MRYIYFLVLLFIIGCCSEPEIYSRLKIGDKVKIKGTEIKGRIVWKGVGNCDVSYEDKHGQYHKEPIHYDELEKIED